MAGEEETKVKKKSKRYFILPNSIIHRIWDTIIAIPLLYYLVVDTVKYPDLTQLKTKMLKWRVF